MGYVVRKSLRRARCKWSVCQTEGGRFAQSVLDHLIESLQLFLRFRDLGLESGDALDQYADGVTRA